METRYKVYQRGNGIYYIQDVVTNQQESLRTRDALRYPRAEKLDQQVDADRA